MYAGEAHIIRSIPVVQDVQSGALTWNIARKWKIFGRKWKNMILGIIGIPNTYYILNLFHLE